MRVIDETEEQIHNLLIESHQEVLDYCKKIEELYNVDILLYNGKGMVYRLQIKHKGNILSIIDKKFSTPAKFKNYLKGLIDAHKFDKQTI